MKLSAKKPVREGMLWILDSSVHIEGTLFNLNHCKVQNTSVERSSCTSHFRQWRFVYLLRRVIYCISYGEFTPQCEKKYMRFRCYCCNMASTYCYRKQLSLLRAMQLILFVL